MRDTIFYIRGPFPFGVEVGISDGLIEDAKILLDLDINQINSIREDLIAFSGFLDSGRLLEILHTYVEDEGFCGRLSHFIAAVDGKLRATGQDVSHLTSSIEKWLDEEENQPKELLTRDQFEELRERLPLLIEPFSGLSRQAKAERLSEATGQPLEDIQIICDLRPVFDEERECVQGVMPFTTLKVVCKGIDGLPVAMETILSRSQVSELLKKATAAEKKLSGLEKLLSEKDLAIPSIGITKQDQ